MMFMFVTGVIAGAAVMVMWGLNQIQEGERGLLEAIRDKQKTIDAMEEEMDQIREEIHWYKLENSELRANKGKLEKPEERIDGI
jgi:hypothetical protein